MPNFDVANLALMTACPGNEILYDDKGMPSIMVKIPKMTWADLGIGTSTETFPAFIVNGQEVDAIYFSKYQNVVQNNRAYSIPAQDPRTSVTLDQSCTYSSNKGDGWHCTTRLEWMVIAWWCLENGYQPLGNNSYGKDYTETTYKAIPTAHDSSTGKITRVATGTGPISWSHNNAVDGIWDMNGNVVEWMGGIRLVYGELQVISHDGQTFGNDAADSDNSQSANAACWYAINGTTGALMAPNGTGTTTNSLKLDRVNNVWTWTFGQLTDKVDESRSGSFGAVACAEGVCDDAKLKLQALGMLKVGSDASVYKSDYFYANNGAAERSFYVGGNYASASYGGVFVSFGFNSRAGAGGGVGFRAAYVKLPTA